MSILKFFFFKQKKTALVAKKRLKIILKEQRKSLKEPIYFPKLKNELLTIISKYTNINPNMIKIKYKIINKKIFFF
ncbi:cell division topological specificity factor MinE [Buchnera aphidicola]|uniref:cell division topological specificity factor MinE n=1 Tax=Buchnera aphidicola TaxID=9 RepID=UPI0031B6BD94